MSVVTDRLSGPPKKNKGLFVCVVGVMVLGVFSSHPRYFVGHLWL